MILQLLPTVQTKYDLLSYYSALLTKYEENRNPAIIFTAQWLTETSGSNCYNNNGSNIKPSYDPKSNTFSSSSEYPNGFCYLKNVSEIINGKEIFFQPPHYQCAFLSFASLDDFMNYKMKKFADRWGKALEAAMKQDVKAFCHELKIANYYTANETRYTNLMFQMYKKVCLATDGLTTTDGLQ